MFQFSSVNVCICTSISCYFNKIDQIAFSELEKNFRKMTAKVSSPGGDSSLIRRVCATGVLNLSPCSGVTASSLYCIVLYCIVLYCIVLYCIVLYCIVLHCNGDKDHVYALLI